MDERQECSEADGAGHLEPFRTYECIAKQIEREDGLVNQRLTWTLQINGFLFASLALLGDRDVLKDVQFLAGQVIPPLGLFVTATGLMGVRAAHLQLTYLANEWDKIESRCPWPQPYGVGSAHGLGRYTSLLAPFFICLAWLYIFLAAPPWHAHDARALAQCEAIKRSRTSGPDHSMSIEVGAEMATTPPPTGPASR